MGSHLAKMLSGNSHDITVIDSDQKALDEVSALADVIAVEGDSTTVGVLRRASVLVCFLLMGGAFRGCSACLWVWVCPGFVFLPVVWWRWLRCLPV